MGFCETIDRIIGTQRKKKLYDDYSFTIFSKAITIPEDKWNACIGNSNLFLTVKYLTAIEQLHEDSMYFRYIMVFKKDQPILVSYFQINDFTADVFGELVAGQLQEIQSKRTKLFEHYLDHNKNKVVFRLVTCGNNFISGEHAFSHSTAVSKKIAFQIMDKVIEVVGKSEKLRGKISATVVKDFEEHTAVKRPLFNDKFVEFSVEPNMVITIPKDVHSLEDYIKLFSKKYRNRAKSIFKCSDGVEKRQLKYEEIKKYNARIYELYEQVFARAKFKLVKLSYDYFAEMQRKMPEQFEVHGYFKDGKLVAFKSAFILEDCIEAHFIGFDYIMNKDLECYQNLLYDFIELSIDKKKSILQLGRTASEIKSTVGAKAEPLVCYVKPQNTVSKMILRPFISFLQPSEWIPRNPFKEEAEVSEHA
jgi:hypothetical protein